LGGSWGSINLHCHIWDGSLCFGAAVPMAQWGHGGKFVLLAGYATQNLGPNRTQTAHNIGRMTGGGDLTLN